VRRGFKAQAERLATAARAELGIDECGRLCPWKFAEHRGMFVWTPKELGLSDQDVAQLTLHDPDSWSGVTVRLGDAAGIVLNNAHPRTRQANTLMHEISHVELRHKAGQAMLSDDGLLLMTDYPSDQEDEANWLAGALLLPRQALLHHRGQGSSVLEIAADYGVSDELCTWRLRMTGVDRQLGVGRRSPFG